MQFSVISLILLSVVSRALTAPATKQDPGSDLKEQMKKLQAHMASFGDQFKTIFQTIMKEKKLGNVNTVDKRGLETSSINKNEEKDIREKLKDVSEQLKEIHEQLNSIREKIHSMKESLDGNDDDDDDDDNSKLDRREVKSPSNDANSPECIKKSIVQESDPFILRIALTIMKRINANEKRVYIEKLVNATANHVVSIMGTTHGVKDFHKRLLNAVLQLLKVRSILIIKTEGEFIGRLDLQKTRTLKPTDKNVDQSKVEQALEELLEGPLIKGFVSKAEEEKMIDSAVKSLGDVFGLSKNGTKSVVNKMISHIEDDVKALEHGKEQGKPMTYDEKIKGLEKMVVDKAKEDKLNDKEMKYLVKGLAAAVAARNNLSASKTEKLEKKILKGVHDYFAAKSKLSEHKKDKGSEQDKDTSKKFEELHVPRSSPSPSGSNNGDGKLEMQKNEDVIIKKTILDKLKELKELANKLSSHSSSGLTGDTADQVTIDAATNTRGSTRIVEQHNVRRKQTKPTTAAPSISEQTANKEANLDDLLNELQKFITAVVPTSKNKTREKVSVDAAKGTIGEKKVDAGFKRKRGLFDIIADAISVIKALKEINQNSKKSRNANVTTEAVQNILPTELATILPTELATEMEKAVGPVIKTTLNPTVQTTLNPTVQTTLNPKVQTTLNPNVQTTKATPSEDVGNKAKKSQISDVMEAELEKAEAEIQKELEKEQTVQEKKLLEEEKNKKEHAEEKKKEEEEKEKQKEEEEKEKQKQKEEDDREKEKAAKEKQKENEEEEKEKEKQKEEEEKEKQKQKEEDDREKEKAAKEKQKENEEKEKQKEEEEKEKQKQKEEDDREKEKAAKEKQKENEEEEKEKQKEEEEKEKQKQKEEDDREKEKAAKEKQKENEEIEKEKQQTIPGNKTKKNDIPDQSEAQLEADEKGIEKELDAQTNGKNKLMDKLQSLQTKQKNSKEVSKDENNELIKELDELFAKN